MYILVLCYWSFIFLHRLPASTSVGQFFLFPPLCLILKGRSQITTGHVPEFSLSSFSSFAIGSFCPAFSLSTPVNVQYRQRLAGAAVYALLRGQPDSLPLLRGSSVGPPPPFIFRRRQTFSRCELNSTLSAAITFCFFFW